MGGKGGKKGKGTKGGKGKPGGKGKVGSWSEQFSDQQAQQFDRVYAKRMDGAGLDFNFG